MWILHRWHIFRLWKRVALAMRLHAPRSHHTLQTVDVLVCLLALFGRILLWPSWWWRSMIMVVVVLLLFAMTTDFVKTLIYLVVSFRISKTFRRFVFDRIHFHSVLRLRIYWVLVVYMRGNGNRKKRTPKIEREKKRELKIRQLKGMDRLRLIINVRMMKLIRQQPQQWRWVLMRIAIGLWAAFWPASQNLIRWIRVSKAFSALFRWWSPFYSVFRLLKAQINKAKNRSVFCFLFFSATISKTNKIQSKNIEKKTLWSMQKWRKHTQNTNKTKWLLRTVEEKCTWTNLVPIILLWAWFAEYLTNEL